MVHECPLATFQYELPATPATEALKSPEREGLASGRGRQSRAAAILAEHVGPALQFAERHHSAPFQHHSKNSHQHLEAPSASFVSKRAALPDGRQEPREKKNSTPFCPATEINKLCEAHPRASHTSRTPDRLVSSNTTAYCWLATVFLHGQAPASARHRKLLTHRAQTQSHFSLDHHQTDGFQQGRPASQVQISTPPTPCDQRCFQTRLCRCCAELRGQPQQCFCETAAR